ncbi:MAG TPA: DbpA RNA binding domain-containing protein, partial [Gemmatimonadaceae bacterium]|nr:DbpA RNA binding domain-containing protein [Gemmatimonadaceae bacterium]
LEPLLGDFDAASVAAAALRLLEAERARRTPHAKQPSPNAPAAAPAAAPEAAPRGPRRTPAGGAVRLFVNVGERDGVSPRDLVGAIANEAGIAGSRIGRVEIRDSHSLVELEAADAERAVEALTGANIRGRRVSARVDRDRPPRERGERGERGGRGDRVGQARGKFSRRPGTRDRGPSRRRDE